MLYILYYAMIWMCLQKFICINPQIHVLMVWTWGFGEVIRVKRSQECGASIMALVAL
jgi:hypothetical protein